MTPADTDFQVASSSSQSAFRIRLQLATLLPTEQAPRSRPPDEVSSDPFDAFHVAHGRPCHRTTNLYRCKLEIWSILRQATDSRVPRDVTTCDCRAVVVIIICHLQSVPLVTVVHVVPLVFGLILPLHCARCRKGTPSSVVGQSMRCPYALLDVRTVGPGHGA